MGTNNDEPKGRNESGANPSTSEGELNPNEGIPPWSFDDPLPGDGRIRERLAYLEEHTSNPDAARPLVTRALGDVLERRFWPEVFIVELSNLETRMRLEALDADEGQEMERYPHSTEPKLVEALWQIDALRARLAEIRRALVACDTEKTTRDSCFELVGKLTLVSTGGASTGDESRRATKRTFVLNALFAVAGLRLPAVLRQLAASGALDAGRLERFLPALDEGDVKWVLALITARYPQVANDLQDEAQDGGLIQHALDTFRAPSREGRRWSTLPSLLDAAGLWKVAPTAKLDGAAAEVARKKDENTLRTTYTKDPDALGDLDKPNVRMLVWARIADFMLSVGLGALTAAQLEKARSQVVVDEIKP